MVDTNPAYRNNRSNYYTEKLPDTLNIGSVVQVLKVTTTAKSFDNSFIPTASPVNGTSSYINQSGNANIPNNPEFQYRGYLYCDGSEYNIKDYPALYEIIGTSYGGTENNGVTITNQGSGYPSTATVTFTAAPSGGVTATGTPVVSAGKIISVAITNFGSGYTTAPTAIFGGVGGSGATAVVRINSQGSIAPVTQETVWSIWPDANMGTFMVPDFKAKKLVGNGTVYGSGTPTIGLSELKVGKDGIGGKWYLDKAAQKGEFSLGKVSTTGYQNVTDSISSQLIGSQTITVGMDEKRLQGAPAHTHNLLHCQGSKDQAFAARPYGDRYLASYSSASGKVLSFLPSGGLALTHKHALVKKPITSNTVATYDIYNYTGGDSGTGTLKTSSTYYASGDSTGTYELVTTTTATLFKKFNSSSQIGGRTVITSGTPIYNFTSSEYNTPQTGTTLSIPANTDLIKFEIFAAAGSGAAYNVAGNGGGSSSVQVGDGSLLTVTAPGGGPGGAASSTSGGSAGSTGVRTVTGSSASNYVETTSSAFLPATAGTALNGGPYYKTSYPDNPNPYGNGGKNGYSIGSNGANLSVSSVETYPGTTYTSNTTGVSISGGSNKTITKIELELTGGSGANCGNLGGNYSTGVGSYNFSLSGCTTGTGIPGKKFKISINSPTQYNSFNIYPGAAGGGGGREGGTSNGGTASYGPGGIGGDGYGSNDGGGGGATTVVTLTNGTVIAGAGGGGGGGGAGEGQCGQSGQPNTQFGDAVQGIDQDLFSGAGAAGGNYGCTGGGGGGGGGGIGTAAQSTAAGGSGGGGGGNGDHGSGDGGARGLSSYRTNYATLVNSGDGVLGQSGRVTVSYQLNADYWSPGGGGGGAGGVSVGSIQKTYLPAQSSLTINVGGGGSGVSYSGGTTNTGSNPVITNTISTVSTGNGGDGFVKVTFGVITGYSGGTSNQTVGDIIKAASTGVEIYTSGSGSGTSGGFKLPTTQVPKVVFEGGGGGSGATATAVVTSGAVSAINLNSGGTGYTTTPVVRILDGAGSGTLASTLLSGNSVSSINLTAGSSTAYTHYVKFGGTAQTRFVITNPVDCSTVKRFGIKVARGNGVNGGDRPENGGDELVIYYNTDGSTNFPGSNYMGTLVPIPTDDEVTALYDGTGSGTEATKWYSYFIDLTSLQQQSGVSFKIAQNRPAASGANDSGSDSDHFGICDFIYEYNASQSLQFVPSAGGLNTSSDLLTYVVEGPVNSPYTTGMSANDVTFTMTSGTPLIPVPSLDPNINIPLLEPYFLVKHMIKAF